MLSYIAQSGDLDMPEGQTLKDRATQLPIKYEEWSSGNAI